MPNYVGNKAIPGVYQKIINQIPSHSYYLECFAGSGAIGRLLPDRAVKHYNDLDRDALQWITVDAQAIVLKTSFPALHLLQLFAEEDKTMFIFLDPPYLHATRASSTLYPHEMSEADHIDLLKQILQLQCNCMIIHPSCELYNDILKDWRTIQIKIRYHQKTSLEKLYMNYDTPPELQTSKFIGKDCWQRQANKRKAERFLKKGQPIPFPGSNYITDMLNLINNA